MLILVPNIECCHSFGIKIILLSLQLNVEQCVRQAKTSVEHVSIFQTLCSLLYSLRLLGE